MFFTYILVLAELPTSRYNRQEISLFAWNVYKLYSMYIRRIDSSVRKKLTWEKRSHTHIFDCYRHDEKELYAGPGLGIIRTIKHSLFSYYIVNCYSTLGDVHNNRNVPLSYLRFTFVVCSNPPRFSVCPSLYHSHCGIRE